MALRTEDREIGLQPLRDALKPFQDRALADRMELQLAGLSSQTRTESIEKAIAVYDCDGYVSPADVVLLASLALIRQPYIPTESIMFHAASAAFKAAMWQQNIASGKQDMAINGLNLYAHFDQAGYEQQVKLPQLQALGAFAPKPQRPATV